YARAGAVVVTYDPIGEGERNAERRSGTRQHDREVGPPELARRLSGLMITDVMQAVSFLARRPDVDSTRMAVLGYSMGSFVSGLTCAVDTRLAACVLAGGGNLDGPGGYWDRSKPMCQGIPYQSLAFLGDRGAAIYDLQAARGATLVINGPEDDVVAIRSMGAPFFEDLRRRTIALHGSDRDVFDYVLEPEGGHRPYFLTRTAALWLERHLHFPSWTETSIAAMPETRMVDWARAGGAVTDRRYADDRGEAGTRVLGEAAPVLPRERLMALPPEVWERDRQKYVYESWLAEARARVEDAAGGTRP
ncbi:MAG TPA: prolyl oligopeptidase family serine peptidase, partial [Longimicrobiales bacterium]